MPTIRRPVSMGAGGRRAMVTGTSSHCQAAPPWTSVAGRRSHSTGGSDDGGERARDDDDIADYRPILDEIQFETECIVPGKVRAPADLPETGDAGLHEQAAMRIVVVERDLRLALRSRPDQTHGPDQRIEELRQFVE